mmetsp:Transcript_9267/g.13771  ORF Transcript_9267/g.13771 Transcript_9267/m.13771 type:complete len:168 (+) Transcript_9267:139-642(+)|eukprot:CAMPEP_0203655560 /NCGR_PEP_ID=MMETSP0088-20131115/38765_1 /ASSEMBLY_ACC=CAM_ASM_001087 /TAXON_ID=426623 /ORGANISM="Chaetoceros affinis, Strain CCMP159" /LENGTH=167 /DNA_ID=CAMNT_0050516215 /DNA_START=139 /DNA_END=642 /DNA_ORIENTATION=+
MKLILLLNFICAAYAFAPSNTASFTQIQSSSTLLRSEEATTEAAPRNPDKPELPEIKGDFDWDAKFGDDDDWIVDNIPGKMSLSDVELAAQNTALSAMEEKYRKVRLQKEYDDARILGWTGQAETFNGRFAMFFLVVGLLTEYWTGITIPGQIEEMLRVGGFIGPEY